MTDVQVTIDIHRHFAASRDVVFKAFTDKDQIATWFGPLAGWVMPDSVSIDPRPGGHRKLTMATYSGSMSWTVDATYAEVVENRRIVEYESVTGFPMFEGVDRFEVRLEFFDEGDGTRLELQVGPCSRETETVHREFWMQSFTKLDELLARRTNEQGSDA
jgi:uncharacterized protein YndB with AHSA1/START domain